MELFPHAACRYRCKRKNQQVKYLNQVGCIFFSLLVDADELYSIPQGEEESSEDESDDEYDEELGGDISSERDDCNDPHPRIVDAMHLSASASSSSSSSKERKGNTTDEIKISGGGKDDGIEDGLTSENATYCTMS